MDMFRTQPISKVIWVHYSKLCANDYNPNSVAPPEMELLALSILEDGWTQPIVCYHDNDLYIIVDGFHRFRTIKENKDVQNMTDGFAPIVIIDKPIAERMASTIRHNRARGKHSVKPMSDIVAELVHIGWQDDEIANKLGMDADEILRLKQKTGLPALFKNREYSRAWE